MTILFIVLFILLGVFKVSRRFFYTPEQIGKEGEAIVHNILAQLSDEYLTLDNIMLKTNRGTTQIDHIVVSKYGVFVIETKNYRGDIYGNDKREQWKQIILTDVVYAKKWYKTYTYVTKNHFYNPVKQALGHTYEIKKQLLAWPNLKIVPIVVFVGEADLRNVYSNSHVIYGYDLISTIQSYTTIHLRDEDVERIYNHICQINASEYVSNATHVHNIHVAQEMKRNKIAEGKCPQCGGNLILRQGKYGHFYGCSNYPNCKFTLNLD